MGGTLNLVVVVVQADNLGARKLLNLTRWAADTASYVQDSVSVLDPNLCGEVVLVAGNGLVEGFTVCVAAEVEGLSPSVLVDVGGEVVVAKRQSQYSDVSM